MANASDLEEITRGNQYRLVKNTHGIAVLELVARTPHITDSTMTRSNSSGNNAHGRTFSPVQPKELRLYIGAGFIIMIVAALSAIVTLESLSSKNNGKSQHIYLIPS